MTDDEICRFVWSWVKKARQINNLNYMAKSWLLFDFLSGNIKRTEEKRGLCLSFLSDLSQSAEITKIIEKVKKTY